jgi:hypothetical protein
MTALHDIEVEDYLYDCATITPEAIQEEFVRVPADLAYWTKRFADASKAAAAAKVHRGKMRAFLYLEHRERLLIDVGKPSEAHIDSCITCDDRMAQAEAALVDAEARKAELWGFVEAVRAKREMLVSLGAQLRAELQNDPVIRRQRAAESEFQRR